MEKRKRRLRQIYVRVHSQKGNRIRVSGFMSSVRMSFTHCSPERCRCVGFRLEMVMVQVSRVQLEVLSGLAQCLEALADQWSGARSLLYKPLSVREGYSDSESAGPAALMVSVTTLKDRLTQRPSGRARSQGHGCQSSLEGACAVLALSADSFLLSLPLSTWPVPMFGRPTWGRIPPDRPFQAHTVWCRRHSWKVGGCIVRLPCWN